MAEHTDEPKLSLKESVAHVLEKRRVIQAHAGLFVSFGVACCLITAIAVRLYLAQQIDILTTSNTQLRDYNNTLVHNAAIVPPSQWRRMTDDERATLISELRSWSAKPKAIAVYAVADSESRQFAAQFVDVFRSLNVEPRSMEVALGFGSVDVGLMVGVQNPAAPSAQAREFFDILGRAGMKPRFTTWAKLGDEPNDFDIFVGPKPW
jgi:hypothetical protein